LVALRKALFQGDTTLSPTEQFDRRDAGRRVKPVVGYDPMPNLEESVDQLPRTAWKNLPRPPRYAVHNSRRGRANNIKDRIVRQRELLVARLASGEVAESAYRPTGRKCYRMMVAGRSFSNGKGDLWFLHELRHAIYIAYDRRNDWADVVFSDNDRCDPENLRAHLTSFQTFYALLDA
jgi:hypothetical protein